MSRARPYGKLWFDTKSRATIEQLELLSDIEGIPIDDLLDEGLTQKVVLFRLHKAGNMIPAHVLEIRRKRQELTGRLPACRICSLNGWQCKGMMTKHHYIPRWLLLELDNYLSYASRSVSTIPLCLGSHQSLHLREDGEKSIAPYLRQYERALAQQMLTDLREQHPQIWNLLCGGDGVRSYEAQLVKDYYSGAFTSSRDAYDLPEMVSKAS